eukprot:tig00021012_g17024.t1
MPSAARPPPAAPDPHLLQKLADQERELKSLKEQREKLKRLLASAEDDLYGARTREGELEGRVRELEGRVSGLQAELEGARWELHRANDHSRCKGREEQLKKNIRGIERRFREARQAERDARRKIEELESRLSDQDAYNRDWGSRTDANEEEERSDYESGHENADYDRDYEEGDYDREEGYCDRDREEGDYDRDREEGDYDRDREEGYYDRDRDEARSHRSSGSADSGSRELRDRVNQLQDEVADLEARNSGLRGRVDELERRCGELDESNEQLRLRNGELGRCNEDLIDRNKELKSRIDELRDLNDELSERNNKLDRDLSIKATEIDHERKRLSQDIKEMSDKLEDYRIQRIADRSAIAIDHMVGHCNERAKTLEKANGELEEELRRAREDSAVADLEREKAKAEKERERRREAQKPNSKELSLARDEAKRMAQAAEAARNEANLKKERLEAAESAKEAAEKARAEAEEAARSAKAALEAAEAAAAEERARWDQLLGELAERAERAERQREEAQALLDAILERPGSDPEMTALKGRVRSLEAQLAEKQKAAAGLSNSSSLPAAAASSDGPASKIRTLRNASCKLVQTIVKQLRPAGSKASKPIEIEVDRAAVVESALRSCLEQRLLEQLRQPAAPLKIAMECAEDRKGPSREFYALFFEELVKKQLVEEPMQRAPGVLPPAAASASAAPVPVVPAPAPAPQPRRKRTVIVDSEDEDESGEDGDGRGPQGENPKRVRLEGGQPATSASGGGGGGQRRSGRGQSSSKRVDVHVDRALLTKYRFIGAIIGRALLERILDPKGTDPIPAAFVPMIPMLSGRQPDSCATAEEALALWQPFLDPQVHVSMTRILAEPVSPEAPVPMDPYLQGCPGFSGEELTEENKRHMVRLAAQWQCVGRRQPLLEAMREGFQGVFTRPEASKKGPEAAAGAADALEAVGLLGADDWAALVGGQAWTAETLIANMRFHGDWRNFEEDRALVERWLFGALRAGEVDPSQFARCIGRASAPASGKLERPLTIAPKTNTVKDGAGRRRAVLVPWSDKEWGLAFRTCFDEVEIPGVPSAGAAGAEEERRGLFVRAVRSSVEDLALDFNDG